ncbi:MAG: hypothetical protein IT384_10035 [Deltaproteobacteria bacterium]|nr:hypothetical protein [Deltaproteobacteria bacterium]
MMEPLQASGPRSKVRRPVASARPIVARRELETDPLLPLGPVATPPLKITDATDPVPITPLRALCLKVGLENGLKSATIPARHYLWLNRIKLLRSTLQSETDESLRARITGARATLAAGGTPRDVLVEVYAVAWEIMRRTRKIQLFDVQVLAAISLADASESGAVVELDTGEGKTFCIACAAVLRALEGRGCHVTTANGSLAEWNAAELEPFYRALGLSVGVTKDGTEQPREDKRAAYSCDITYGTASAFGFDHLRDALAREPGARVQRPLHAVIVDELDDILIDSATTPLRIASGGGDREGFEAQRGIIELADQLVRGLDPARHLKMVLTRDQPQPILTERGLRALARNAARLLAEDPRTFNLWDASNGALVHAAMQAVAAHHAVRRDRDYVVEDERIVLVDQGTGHAKRGSMWSDGLHEAVLVKEGLPVGPPHGTLAEISIQSYFKKYRHLSGMTGTAAEARDEIAEIYRRSVLIIPRHLRCVRQDLEDRFFVNPALRDLAAFSDLIALHQSGRPVLVSSVSVDAAQRFSRRLAAPLLLLADLAVSSETLFRASLERLAGGAALLAKAEQGAALDEAARAGFREQILELLGRDAAGCEALVAFLESRGIPARPALSLREGLAHRTITAETLTAEEAAILRDAGKRGAITIGTQKVGRGVDIKIDDPVRALGGLHIIGLERQTNARKDRQIQGRAGRQGDPGSTQFYVSLGDAVMTYLPADTVRDLASRLEADVLAEPSSSLTRRLRAAVKEAQAAAEAEGLAARKRLFTFDGVVDGQREVVEARRGDLLSMSEDALRDRIAGWLLERVDLELAWRQVRPPSAAEVHELSRWIDPESEVPASLVEAISSELDLALPDPSARTVASFVTSLDEAVSDALPGAPAPTVDLVRAAARRALEQVIAQRLFGESRPPRLSAEEATAILEAEETRGSTLPMARLRETMAAVGSGAALEARGAVGVGEARRLIERRIAGLVSGLSPAARDLAASILRRDCARSLAEPFAFAHRAPGVALGASAHRLAGDEGHATLYGGRFVRSLLAGITPHSPEGCEDDRRFTAAEVRERALASFSALWREAMAASSGRAAVEVRGLVLSALDRVWVSYVEQLEDLRQSAQLQTYRQKNPYVEFASMAAKAFSEVSDEVKREAVVGALARLRAGAGLA